MARKSVRKPEVKASQITHPNSRKAKQLSKKTSKIIKRNKSKLDYQMRLNLLGEKILYFRDNLVKNNDICTPTILSDLINKYLSRFDDELEQITLKHSIGQRDRQHASREDTIKMTKDRELEEYTTCGIELPDFLNGSEFKKLKEWNGEIRFIQTFKLRRFSKSHLEKLKAKKSNSTENDELQEKME